MIRLTDLVVLGSLLALVYCDTPANCTYDDIRGKWLFFLSEDGHTNYNINCQNYKVQSSNTITLEFIFPDVVIDQNGSIGKWTMVYNQGFGFTINKKRFFAFSKWSQNGKSVLSECHMINTGWYHDIFDGETYPVKNWGCYTGGKLSSPIVHESTSSADWPMVSNHKSNMVANYDMVGKINDAQSSWKAGLYNPSKHEELQQMFTHYKKQIVHPHNRIHPKPATFDELQQASSLPDSFDWRNVDGVNYVSPIRNQGSCGSCYAFASMGMLECRIRVLSNNTMQPILSTEYVVSCGNYSQGCAGGFPYLVAGQFGIDFGNIEESCYPYTAAEEKCKPVDPKCKIHYTKSFDYIGGFYGASNEPLMRLNIVKEGPLAVSIMVYKDLQLYTSGIYHHTTALDESYNPFEVTNHVVVVVGYGADPKTGEKYWIVKNSWGTNWGESGFFRIRRGTDEIAIESIAVKATPNISA